MRQLSTRDTVEPPSWCQPPIFMIGQNSRGQWVVQDLSGLRGGLFVDRAQALRYIRFENGNRPHAFVAISGAFELDMYRNSGVAGPQLVETSPARRVA